MEIVNLRHIQNLKNILFVGSSFNDALGVNSNKKPDRLGQDAYAVLKKRYDNK